MALGSTQPLTEMSTRCIYHHPVPLSWNLGTLTSWNPLGHSRPVTGLLYLYLLHAQYVLWCIWQCTHTVCSEHKPQSAALIHTVSLTSHHFHKMVERCLIIVEDQHILTCVHKLKIKLIITGCVLQVSTPYTKATSLVSVKLKDRKRSLSGKNDHNAWWH